MAKFLTGNGGGKYMDPQAKFNVISYILNPDEDTPSSLWIF